MNIYGWFLVIFATFVILPLGVAWWMGRHPRVPLARLADPAPLPCELPRASRLVIYEDEWHKFFPPTHAGAADPAQQLAPVPWDLAGAAYVLGQQRADQDAVSREVDAIMAEIEYNPERWGGEG